MPGGICPPGIFYFHLESAQRELVSILLNHIHSLGLISDFIYSGAVDLVHSVIDFPEFFRYPVCLTKEASYGVMCANAGHKPPAKALTAENIYTEILAASEALDNAEVPETGRALVVTPATYALMKKSNDITLDSDVGQEQRLRGVIGILDGASVVKVPAVRLPADFGFMLAHPVAVVVPVKLEDYTIHDNPPGISGALVEGRICYGAFVLDNKAKTIYYQAQPAGEG